MQSGVKRLQNEDALSVLSDYLTLNLAFNVFSTIQSIISLLFPVTKKPLAIISGFIMLLVNIVPLAQRAYAVANLSRPIELRDMIPFIQFTSTLVTQSVLMKQQI